MSNAPLARTANDVRVQANAVRSGCSPVARRLRGSKLVNR
jgi:hypothetical protein